MLNDTSERPVLINLENRPFFAVVMDLLAESEQFHHFFK